jgi:hypothetical protein
MWFMNKIANPFVRLILRSPFHGMLSAALLLITYHGCKSGKEYTLPVQYALDNKTIYIIPGTPEKKIWWRNLCSSAPVQILLAGKLLSGEANVLEGNNGTELVTRALDFYLQRFPATAKMYNIRTRQDGSFDRDDLRRAASSIVIVRVNLE